MRNRQIAGMIVLLFFAFVTVCPGEVSARSTSLSLDTTLTPQEQAAKLWELAGQMMVRKLFPSTPDSVKPLQRDYHQRAGGNISPAQLRDIAKEMGEKGGAWYAAKHGLTELLGAKGSGIPQGPDSVYWDPYSGYVVVLETKGGYAKIADFYGARQNTNRYSVRAAEVILKSQSATRKAKVAAARIVVAAQEGRLVTGATGTGPRGDPLLIEDKWDVTNVAEEAREIERRNPENRKAFHRARLTARMTRGVAITGFAGALALGWDAKQQAQAAWSMFDDPTLKGSTLPFMQTGTAFGRVAQAATWGVISTAQLGIWRLSTTVAGAQRTTAQAAQLGVWRLSARGAIRAAGLAFIPITLGLEGLQWAMVNHEHHLGRISQREFYRRSTAPAIMAVFTAGGATVGGIIGFKAGGVSAIPGAMIGANIGAFAAIPVQIATDYMVDRYYREFDEHQRRVVNAAVEAFYGLETRSHVVQH